MKKNFLNARLLAVIVIMTLPLTKVEAKWPGYEKAIALYDEPFEPPFVEQPPFEEINIYRMQIRIETCNNYEAGTDDDVYVQMNESDEKFFLDKAKNDFSKGHTTTYDVLSESIRKIKDIQFLKMGIRGDDATCFRIVELIINNNKDPIFQISYPDHGKWIDDNKSFTIPARELRASAGWKYTAANQHIWKSGNGHISKATILSMIECSIGNQLNLKYGDELAWGKSSFPRTLFGPGVEVTYVNNKTLHFDLDLQGKIKGPNPEVDVDFDLVISCNNGQLETKVKNVKVKTIEPLMKWMRDKAASFLGIIVGAEVGEPEFGKAFGSAISKYLTFSIDNINGLEGSVAARPCRTVEVTRDCEIIVNKNVRDHRHQ